MEISLDGRRALVTGGGQGVGRGIALGLAAAGAEVVVNDIRLERADAVAAAIREAGGTARPSVFDVTDLAAVTGAVEEVRGVDILVNNAGNAGIEGFGTLRPFVETGPAEWEPFVQVNLYGVVPVDGGVVAAVRLQRPPLG